VYVGVGASRVRDLFEQAKTGAPSIVCIVEIDAVGRRRGAGLGGGNDEREQTLNQLLVEMDGFGTNEGVIVMAATNRQDILDPALMRPGRFDRQIYINPPDVQGREAILKVHAKEKLLADDVDFKVIAHATGGFTGADLANLLNEAALYAAKHNSPVITMQALEESILKIIAGPEKRSHVRLERDRRITAYHEAGHAVAMHVLPTQDPVHSITIVPRGNALGMTISLPEEDTDHMTRNEMREKIVGLLGGRVAEKLVFDDISTGASNDIQRASRLARDMIARYGMSERIGTVAFDDGDEIFVGRDYERTKAYSEHTGGEIDAEMKRVIDEAYKRCEDILTENRSKLDEVAAFLLEHETMSRKQFEACMNGEAIPETAEGFFETVESAPEAPADAEASNQ
ncbi:MAG: AAA family ATPase, partial [Clostridia bacterium]|nr:AAA family ATPase [Clostridia bacterium]